MHEKSGPSIESKSGLWLGNPAWAGERENRIVHGMLTRRGFDREGKLPLGQAIEIAAPRLLERMELNSSDSSVPSIAMVGADQVHGDRIEVVSDSENLTDDHRLPLAADRIASLHEIPETDALIATRLGIVLVIQTADCLPILFLDRDRSFVGACHCGWRGLEARLAEKTARKMIELGADPRALEAWIAPGIRTANYEVSAELVDRFRGEFPGVQLSPDGRRLDLVAVAVAQLESAGLPRANIVDSGLCTFADSARLHSYRRDGEKSGRLLTFIGLAE